ncbi:MAG: tripartite tricarboxylate transporter TctB family protein [Pseudomonadota bacterium]
MALVRQKAFQSKTWWIGIGVFVFAAITYLVSRDYGRGGMMPGATSIAIMGLALIHTAHGLIAGVVANDEDWHDEDARKSYNRRRWMYVGLALVVGFGVWLVGFHIALPIFLVTFIGMATGRWIVGVLLAAAIWAFTYLVLSQTLHIVFPSSVLQRWMIANGWF